MTGVLIREQHEDTEAHREKTPISHVMMGAETEMSKEYLGHQELEETRKDPLLEASEGAWLCPHFDFGLLISEL